MDECSLSLEPRNPGHVFACLGLFEVADALGSADHGWFTDNGGEFRLSGARAKHALAEAVEFLLEAKITMAPLGSSGIYPAREENKKDQPVRLTKNGVVMTLEHWVDGSGRDPCKFHAGDVTAFKVLERMRQPLAALREEPDFLRRPFDALAPMASCFNLDAGAVSTSLDAGFERDQHKRKGANRRASPLVEILGPVGLQNARPRLRGRDLVRYAVWLEPLPISLARAAFSGVITTVPCRRLKFSKGIERYKLAAFAEEDPNP